RHVLEAPMLYEDGAYSVDWEALEKVLAHPLTTMMIVCNPHNPTGHVWSEEELERIGFLCARHDVKVLADEIHCDLTLPGVDYHPFGEVCGNPDNMITCVSTSKAFNLAGLQAAAVIVPNPTLRKVIDRGLNSDELAEPNAFAVAGMVAALTESADWLDELREYLAGNRKAVEDYLGQNLPTIHSVKQEATYLMWLDVGAITQDAKPLCEHIRATTGLWVIAGNQYHGNGNHFVRVNIACPRVTLMDGLGRLKKGIESYK
ncbi:MAG: aminotransferase class I/II-fold pyridoxal phosphate-dependent enzyme, partial [Clostridia bacterium]|nr:aminotransferase class I/II-fold pyridoxal phosphate-dependent enzyme [Clostridia bacterium]